MQTLPGNIIDFHVHLFPDRMYEAVLNLFHVNYQWDLIHHFYYQESIDYLRDRGVGPIVYSNYAHRKDVAPSLNAWNIALLNQNPDLFCLAAFHPDDDDALARTADILDHPQVAGIKFQLLVQNFYPHDKRLFPLYELVMEKRKHLLFHVGTGPVANEFVGFSHFRQLLDRYPALPATIAHMGAMEFADFASLLDMHPSLYLDTAFAFLTKLGHPCDLPDAFLEDHREQILYGSDFPLLLFPREEEIEHLLAKNLSQEFYNRIFRENGLALLKKAGCTI